jgi:serine protease inhibitor
MRHLNLAVVLCLTLIAAAGGVFAQDVKAAANPAVAADGDFAFDLYAQLAKENDGKNMFFSPYSMSIALAMTAEGARGKTADEMGKVLRFPESVRRVGDESQLMPWKMDLIHAGLAELNGRFAAGPKPKQKEILAQIAELRAQLDEANKKANDSAKDQAQVGGDPALFQKAQDIAAKLNKLLPQVNQYELRVANSLWGENTYPFNPAYLDTINKYYKTGGGAYGVDYRTDFEGARAKINTWVEGQTNQRIKDMIPTGLVDKHTRLVLVNAIYFKGEWQSVFLEAETKEEDFHLGLQAAGKGTVRVPLMQGNVGAGYAAFKGDGTLFETPDQYTDDQAKQYPDAKGFQMLELPYKGGELSMVVLLPRSADGLAGLEKTLTAKKVAEWAGKLHSRTTDVFLPKFRLETRYDDMKSTLEAMGMPRAFSKDAEFDGMTLSVESKDKLHISQVLHKAFVEVNEKGTEAAAATAVVMMEAGAPPSMPFVPAFRADKPFVFAIRDVSTGTILFMGRMLNPKE